MVRADFLSKILSRLSEKRQFIQVLSGPRQVGKTTLANQVQDRVSIQSHYASADTTGMQEVVWLRQQWEIARLHASQSGESLLIIDEIQKISDWPAIVKELWDEDTRKNNLVKLLLLGSSPLLIRQGLTESLAGRFELLFIPHWSFKEMRECFNLSFDQYCYYGGYPGAASLISDNARWKRYILDSLIETTISKDILQLNRVQKPGLLRQLFFVACDYSGQVLSYQKMLGQLDDAGNTQTLAHYLNLLSGAGMVKGLSKLTLKSINQKASSPKLQVLNTGLMSATQIYSFEEAIMNREYWGRLVESTVGCHLINSTQGTEVEVLYWQDRNMEVDFCLKYGGKLIGIEVKSGKARRSLPGMAAFQAKYKAYKVILVGGDGIPLDKFVQINPIELF